jgi:hypothetical protein
MKRIYTEREDGNAVLVLMVDVRGENLLLSYCLRCHQWAVAAEEKAVDRHIAKS